MAEVNTTFLLAAYVGDKILVPFINKLLGSYADDMKALFSGRTKKLFGKSEQMLSQAKVEPQQVDLKLLKPIVEGAVLEEDESLATKWAALLANAATFQGHTLVEPSFADVLRQLTPLQAQILDKVYSKISGAQLEDENYGRQSVALREIRQELGVEFVLFERSMDNLMRLQLCTKTPTPRVKNLPGMDLRTAGMVDPTLFGYAFVKACTPPTVPY